MSDSKKTFNFGILGCGMIAEIHAKAIASVDCAELIGVTDNAADRATFFAEKYGVECYQSYESMLADPRIDAVCICTPSCFHAENAIKAMEKGKHVAVEKPMAIDLKEADEVVAVSRRTGKYLTVISQLRFADEIVKVKKMIDENAFGRITLCSLSMKYYRSPEYYSSSSWKGTKKFDGGGALMNQGIHGIDLLQYLVGPMTNVNGVAKTLCHNIEVEDTAVATFELENGALGVLEASTCTYPGFSRRIEIHGERGYVSLLENNIDPKEIQGFQN